ncbi:renin receptor [Zootermopsis nevadensis]|uniref:Renin receptor n=1 Tax=Zootermopsis nevadensis TaxID=136037 RepID=A0A067RIG8_ZOONE|nr:renin receptor [Zootermopsis nevadensis]KDR20235.1 Renin receptor [Zootermopsis nevadensis]
MLKIFLCVAAVVVAAYGAGELVILDSPDSTKFSGHEQIDESMLKEIFAVCMGFTITKGSDWRGLSVSNPFSFAEAVVVVVVDGVSTLGWQEGHRYPLITDEDESVTWQALHDRVLKRYPRQNATLLRMDFAEQGKPYRSFFGDYKDTPTNWTVKYLDPTVSEDKQFLDEMMVLSSVANLVESGLVYRDGVPDVYWKVVRSLHPVVDFHGPDSEAAKEAKQILQDVINVVKKAYVHAYKNRVVVATVCSDVSHTRRTRSLMADAEDPQIDLNLAPEYSPDYPVIFNIFLWFGVAFTFSLLAISLFIADMDPGRDSIIYRMTSTRMKKEN